MTSMADHARERLIEDVLAVTGTLIRNNVEWYHDEVTREMVSGTLCDVSPDDLAQADARRELTSRVWTAKDVALGDPLRNGSLAFAIKVALVVSDLRAGRPERVQPWEAKAVHEVLGLRPPSLVGVPRDSAGVHRGPDGSVGFVFPWRPTPVRTRQRLGTMVAYAAVSDIDPTDAPVACSLWTPDGYLEVRRLGSTWLRPILSPGSWLPLNLAGFRQAAASGSAWRDNPFLPRTGPCCPTFDIDDYAGPRLMASGDERRIAEARDACLARAGALFDVGGVVHRVTKAPLGGLGTVFVNGLPATGPTWVMDDLRSTSSMDTLGHLECPGASWFNRTALPEPRNEAGHARATLDERWVSLSEWVGLADVLTNAAPYRSSAVGPWPASPKGLVHVTEEAAAADLRTSLGVAARHATRLSLVASPLRRGGTADAFEALRDGLTTLVAAKGDEPVDASILMELRASGEDVLTRAVASEGAHAGMWTYVAALVSYATARELGVHDDDPGLTDLCI